MEDLEQVVGADFSVRLTFHSLERQGCAESWFATLNALTWPGDDGPDERVVATAVIVRVNLDEADWLDSLDAESGDLLTVGAAFRDIDIAGELDEEAYSADSLLILDHVSVPQGDRGQRLSHRLVHGVAAIFRKDIVALTPDGNSLDAERNIVADDGKFLALVRHWERAGFVNVPGTTVYMLPSHER